MSYNDPRPEQLGSQWVTQHSKDPERITEAMQAGALQDLMEGRDPDACPTCSGSGKRGVSK